MKAKYALIALLAITFFGCDDNTAGLGLGMFPGSDQNINGKLTTFDVTTKSVHAGEVYAKTSTGYVGKFTDDTFGTYEAGFLSELNCPEGLSFSEMYKENEAGTKATGSLVTSFDNIEIDSKIKDRFTLIKDENNHVIGNCQINIYLWYSSYFGDSLTACRLSIYELDKRLNEEEAYYTNINPEDYYKQSDLLGTKAYTAVDLSVSDSIRKLDTYVPSVSIRLDQAKAKKLGQKLFKADRKDFYKAFPDLFSGIYVKSDYGDGTVLYISQVQMDVVSIEYVTDSITGIKLKSKVNAEKDSIQYTGRTFNSTREIIQANRLANDTEAIQKCIDNSDWTYLKSPAGIFTQVTLPVSQIAEKLEGDTLNAVKLGIPIYNETSDKKFGMSTPKNVLLIRKKYKDSFFKDNQLSDGITSSLFNPTTSFTQYTFNNITQMINDCLADGEREEAEKKLKNGGTITLQITNSEGETDTQVVHDIEEWEKYSDWNKFILIPVLVTTDASSSNSYYGSSSNVISIQHDLKPGYARLKGGTNSTNASLPKEEQDKYKLKLEVVSTNFGTKSK